MVDEALKKHFFNAINLAKSYKNDYFIFGHLLIEILQSDKVVRDFFKNFSKVVWEEIDENGDVNAEWKSEKIDLKPIIKDLKDYVTQCAGDWNPPYYPTKNKNGKYVDDLEGTEFDSIDEFVNYMITYNYHPEFSADMVELKNYLDNEFYSLRAIDLLAQTLFANDTGIDVEFPTSGRISVEDYVMIFKQNGITRRDFFATYNPIAQKLPTQGKAQLFLTDPNVISQEDFVNSFTDAFLNATQMDAQTEPNEQNANQNEVDPNEFLINLNEKAAHGKFDKLIGREKEIAKTLQTLCRRKKNNPMLLGEAGVGKTAIVEGIASKLVENKVPSKLQGKIIYALDTGALIAGTTLRGQFEERAKVAIDWVKSQENAIVFIDEIHTIMGLGDGEGTSDLASIIKPALANGEISCIGATTYSEFRKFEKDKALMRRFSKVDIIEPSIEESVEILKGIASKYEDFHAVKFSDEVLHEAVVLAKRYISDKFLPDSAIDLIDETGASFWIKNEKRVEVSKDDLLNTLGEMANISNLSQNEDNQTTLLNLEANIKKEIFGQDEAVGALCKALFRSYAGLKNDTSPIGVFLFTGSSGVGKTELAKVLAKNLGVYFDRYDMSEYMEEYSVSKLIGSAPGYVGFENGGMLTNSVRKHPYSVILFDEIEKAHQNLMNIFLGIFDNATLSDNTGETADFKNTIIIMTSNLGTKEAPQIGFQKDDSYKIDNAVKGFFAPEFRNRLDKIINFNPLNNEILEKIVDKSVSELESRLQGVSINLSAQAKEFLIKKGYSAEFGARNLKRVINAEISDNLSSEILFGKLKNGGVVNIDASEEKLSFKFKSANSKEVEPKTPNSPNINIELDNVKIKK